MTDTNKSKQPKILVVEDEEQIREILTLAFENKGFQVGNAGSGKEALNYLETKSVDLVLTDIRMHHGTGIELLESLREQSPSNPAVIVMSAYSDISNAEAYARGSCKILEKPFDIKKAIEIVSEYARPLEELWKRTPHETEAKISLTFESIDEATSSGDLALGHCGFFIKNQDNFKIDSFLKFEINFHKGPVLKLSGDGTVRWSRQDNNKFFLNGIGVEFNHISDDSFRYLQSLAKDEKLSTAFIPIGELSSPRK